MYRKVYFIEMTNMEDGNIFYFEPFLSKEEFENEKKLRFDEMSAIDSKTDYGTYQVVFTNNYLLRTSFGYHLKFDSMTTKEYQVIEAEETNLSIAELLFQGLMKIESKDKVRLTNQYNDEVTDFRIHKDNESNFITIVLEENYQNEDE